MIRRTQVSPGVCLALTPATSPSPTGELVFATAPDYEAAADADTDNVYEVTVEVSDGTNNDSIDVTITVTDVDEAPLLTGNANITYTTGGTDSVATYAATDPEGASVTWSLSGADADDFTITGGVLAFAATPDISAPTDTDTDNVYEVTVEAGDGTNTASITVTVTVTDEAPPTLLERYDENDSGEIEKDEMFNAINDYLFGTGDDAISKADMFAVINLYLFG